MNKCSGNCVFDYYEYDTNYGECRHPDFDPNNPDRCPGYLSKDDSIYDAKVRFAEKG